MKEKKFFWNKFTCVILNTWSIKYLFNFRLKTPICPNRIIFYINTTFLLKTQMFIVRGGEKVLVGKILSSREREPFLVLQVTKPVKGVRWDFPFLASTKKTECCSINIYCNIFRTLR